MESRLETLQCRIAELETVLGATRAYVGSDAALLQRIDAVLPNPDQRGDYPAEFTHTCAVPGCDTLYTGEQPCDEHGGTTVPVSPADPKQWRLEYRCDGAPFIWTGKAKTFVCADMLARRQLGDREDGFDRFGARLVSSDQQS